MKSVLIIGMGRLGATLAVKMSKMGNEVMAIDKNADRINAVSPELENCMVGDCTSKPFIESLGVDEFDICFVMIGGDFQSSLVTTYLLKKNGAGCIVCKARQSIQAELLKDIGADEIIFPEKEMATRLAVRYTDNKISDYIKLTDEDAVYEVPVFSSWIDKSIQEINVRAKYGVSIILIKNGPDTLVSPGAEYVFRAGDLMMMVGSSDNVTRMASKVK